MREPSQQSTAAGIFSGRLEGFDLPDLIWALARRRKTGVLHLVTGEVHRGIYFDAGRVTFASSTDPADRLGERLLRAGRIGLQQLERAVSNLHKGKRIGALLVESGDLTEAHLAESVSSQLHSIVLDLFRYERGEYRFAEGPLPTVESITLATKTAEVVIEGIRSIRSFRRIRQAVGPVTTVCELAENWAMSVDGLKLREGEASLIERLELRSSTVEALCRDVFLSNFEVYQALWGLLVLGVVRVKEIQIRERTALHEGVLADRSFADVLVGLCRAGERGVLHVQCGSVERTFHLENGTCVFATSSDIDDGLIAFLLRRGVISVSDREETAKRLLSNKRVGTILLDLGVIDEVDLEQMVRLQLAEVLYDTFRWNAGEFAFLRGELPTLEQITLGASLESLVAEGLRRVTAWQRVREGLGGLEQPLRLTPEYLDVLDRMGAGPDEWGVLATLQAAPLPAAEICHKTEQSDFRVCQILWTLRVLGAVEPVPAAAVEVAVVPPAELIPQKPLPAPREEDETVPTSAMSPLDLPLLLSRAAVGFVDRVEDPGNITEASSAELTQELSRSELESAWSREAALGDAAGDEREEEVPSAESTQELSRAELESAWSREAALGDAAGDEREEAVPSAESTQELSRSELESAWSREAALGDAAGDEREEAVPSAESTQELSRAELESAWSREAALGDAAGDEREDEVPSAELTQELSRAVLESAWSREAALGDAAGDEREEAVPSAESTQELSRSELESAWSREAALGDAAGDEREEAVPSAESTQELSRAELESAWSREAAAGDAAESTGTVAIPIERGDLHEPWTDEVLPESVALSADAATDLAAELPEYAAELEAPEPIVTHPWKVPEDLDQAIGRLNAMQRVVYRAVRSEVGAGAANFIRSCCDQLASDSAASLAGAELCADGSWDNHSLRRAVERARIVDPWSDYRRLIERELDALRVHIGDARVLKLKQQVDRIVGYSG